MLKDVLYYLIILIDLSDIIPHPLLLSRHEILIFDSPSKIFTKGIVETLKFTNPNAETFLPSSLFPAFSWICMAITPPFYLSTDEIRICFKILN